MLLKKNQDEYIYVSMDVSDVRFIMSGNMSYMIVLLKATEPIVLIISEYTNQQIM